MILSSDFLATLQVELSRLQQNLSGFILMKATVRNDQKTVNTSKKNTIVLNSHFLKMRCRSKSVSRFCYFYVKLLEGQIGLSCLPCLVSNKQTNNNKTRIMLKKVNSRPKGYALVSICVSPFFPMLLRKRTSRWSLLIILT